MKLLRELFESLKNKATWFKTKGGYNLRVFTTSGSVFMGFITNEDKPATNTNYINLKQEDGTTERVYLGSYSFHQE